MFFSIAVVCVCVFLPAVGYALLPAVGYVLSACCWRCALCSFSLTAPSTAFELKHPLLELLLKNSSLTSCLRSPAGGGSAVSAVAYHDVRFRHREHSCAQRTPCVHGSRRRWGSLTSSCSSSPSGLQSREVSRCSSRSLLLGLVPDGQSAPSTGLACTDRRVGETCGLSMPACHVREAHDRRCPTGTAHDTPVGRPRVRGSLCRAVRSSLSSSSMYSSCIRIPIFSLDLCISSLYAPARKNWQVHITNAICRCLPVTSVRELL